jgi:sec-independent protein translocase protein TatA
MRTLAFLSGNEVIILAVVLVVLFGSTQLPKLARSIHQARRELQESMDDGTTPPADRP